MSAPSRPGVGDAILVIAGMAWARVRRGKSFYVSCGLLLLPVLIAAAFKGVRGWEAAVNTLTLNPLFLFIPALHCAGILADELDDRTYTYLFTRPIPRWTLIAGKLLTVYVVLLIGFLTSVTLCWFITKPGGAEGFRHYRLEETLLATGLGVFASCCLAASMGAVFPRRPFAAVFAWILGVEMIIGSMPTVLAKVALAYHVRRLADFVPRFHHATMPSFAGSVGRLLQLSAIFLAIAVWRLTRAEYRSET